MLKSLTQKPGYKWIILLIACLMVAVHTFNYYVCGPLVTEMMDKSGFSLGQAGQMTSSFYLFYGIAVLFVPAIINRIGTRKTCLLSCVLLAIGGIMAFFCGENYSLHIVGRLIGGAGFALYFTMPGVIISQWFPANQQSMMQGVRASFDYIWGPVAFLITIPVANAVGSWQGTMGVFGLLGLVVLVIIFIFLADKKEDVSAQSEKTDDGVGTKNLGLLYVLKQKWAWAIAIGMVGECFMLNVLSTYLPAFLELERGYTAEGAASLSSVLQFAAFPGSLVAGAIASKSGREKINGIAGLLLNIIGCVMTATLTSPVAITIGIILFGFGVGLYMTFYFAAPTVIAGGNYPGIISGSVGLTISLSMIIPYFYPQIMEWMTNSGMTMSTAFLIFSIPCVFCILPVIFMREYGEKGKWALRGEKAYPIEVQK